MFATLLFISSTTSAQRCATVEYQQLRQKVNPQLEREAEFENWLQQQLTERKKSNSNSLREEATVVTIPVVVHVIHEGEAIGMGTNIPEGQILSQIEVLTEDFRRMNEDASNTPASFVPVAADVEIEFVLAKRDPEGLPTDGIVRVNGQQSHWSLVENYELKRLSYWPAEDYLNIWVTDITGNFLGYAQFPTSATLSGLENGSDSRLTDGVVIDYRTFGSKEKYAPANLITSYNLGRTTTHEIGHFFGLRHTWGDDSGGCSETDYVNDTPNQGGSTSGCPGTNPTSCGSEDMIQNYMDYTDDACMNLFTADQKTRMRTILENSPRRASLLTSKGAEAPVIVSNDMGLRDIINPEYFACSGNTIPSLQIRNYGDNPVTSVQIVFTLNETVQQTTTFPVNLAPLEIDTVDFNAVNLTTGQQKLKFEIVEVNNVSDGNSENNSISMQLEVPEVTSFPIVENFNALSPGQVPPLWTVLNPDGLYTWQAVTTDNGNTSFGINLYDYEVEGEYDTLLSPVFDLSTVPFAVLSFDRAYAAFSSADQEGLIIAVSTNCGQSFDHIIFENYGEELATVSTFSEFTPSGPSDWKRECLILSDFLGMSGIRVAFIAKNHYGNNLYIDNISIDSKTDAGGLKDIGLVALGKPGLVSCPKPIIPTVIVKNNGCTTENEVTISYQFDDGAIITNLYTVPDFIPGLSIEIPLEAGSFDIGKHTYSATLINSNDSDDSNEAISGVFHINNDKDFIPIKENFEDFKESEWLVIDQDNDVTWQTINTNKGTSLYLDAENYIGDGQQEWLVSPVLDFRTAQEATLAFDIAYSQVEDSKDGLTIQVSTDCGVTYSDILFNRFGTSLHTGVFTGVPESDSVWSRITIDMSDYIGLEEVRIAFISTNNNGSNIYLDNIQTYVTEYAVTDTNVIYPNPSFDGTFNVVFDLPKKETVHIIVYDRKGQLLLERTYKNTLNQTYSFNYEDRAQGIYLVKVVGETFSYVKRIVLFP